MGMAGRGLQTFSVAPISDRPKPNLSKGMAAKVFSDPPAVLYGQPDDAIILHPPTNSIPTIMKLN